MAIVLGFGRVSQFHFYISDEQQRQFPVCVCVCVFFIIIIRCVALDFRISSFSIYFYIKMAMRGDFNIPDN